MKKVIRGGVVIDAQPFDNPPDEFVFYVRDRWLAGLDERASNPGPLDDRMIAYIEYEAVSALRETFPELPTLPVIDRDRPISKASDERPRSKFSPQPAPTVRDTYEAAFERWRCAWVSEAYHHEHHTHNYPKKIESALNILLAASKLRSAIALKDSERAAALGMLIAFEAIGGGYGLDMEAKIEGAKAKIEGAEVLRKSRADAYKNGIGKIAIDLKKAKAACIKTAADIWKQDRTMRMGKVKTACQKSLLDHFELYPSLDKAPKIEAIHGWLTDAEKEGLISIPSEARKPGPEKRR